MSNNYKERVAKLTEKDLMHEAWHKVVAAAKESGMWDCLNDVDAQIKPGDFVETLEMYPSAQNYYDAFPESAKRDILRWIKLAKKPETRARRSKEATEFAPQNLSATGTRQRNDVHTRELKSTGTRKRAVK